MASAVVGRVGAEVVDGSVVVLAVEAARASPGLEDVVRGCGIGIA